MTNASNAPTDAAAGGAAAPEIAAGVRDEQSSDEQSSTDGAELGVPNAAVLAFFETERHIAEEAVKQNLDGVARSRKRADSWGKGVLGVATTLLTVLGIGKLTDFLPQSGAFHQIAATVGLVVALGAVMFVGLRLSRVSLPIVMRADIEDMKKNRQTNPDGLGRKEAALVDQVYKRFAVLNGVQSVADYATVATVIERTFTILADRGQNPADITPNARAEAAETITEVLLRPPIDGATPAITDKQVATTYVKYTLEHPDLARSKAALVATELRYVMTNALADLTNRRAVNATTDKVSLAVLALVPIGVLAAVAFTYFGNASDLRRNQQWQDAKTCVEVANTIRQSGLDIGLPHCVFPAPFTTESAAPKSPES
ncbi:hypothetical protein ACXPWS_05080 [Mycobacterium sp. BMJ-28]